MGSPFSKASKAPTAKIIESTAFDPAQIRQLQHHRTLHKSELKSASDAVLTAAAEPSSVPETSTVAEPAMFGDPGLVQYVPDVEPGTASIFTK